MATFIRKVGKNPTKAQRLEAFKKRDRLKNQIDTFHSHAAAYWLKGISLDKDSTEYESEISDFSDEDNQETIGLSFCSDPDDAEKMAICLPSSFGSNTLKLPFMQTFLKQEIKLREGQANDALQGLRLALCRKSVLFQTDLWHQNTKKGKTRSWQEIHQVNRTAQHFVKIYNRARAWLLHLSAPAETMNQFQPLEKEHLNIKSTVINPTLRGTRDSSLAWFWTMDVQGDIRKVDAMSECKIFNYGNMFIYSLPSVYHVH